MMATVATSENYNSKWYKCSLTVAHVGKRHEVDQECQHYLSKLSYDKLLVIPDQLSQSQKTYPECVKVIKGVL